MTLTDLEIKIFNHKIDLFELIEIAKNQNIRLQPFLEKNTTITEACVIYLYLLTGFNYLNLIDTVNDDYIYNLVRISTTNFDIFKFCEHVFNRHQIMQIALGLMNEVDVDIYNNDTFDSRQMEQIRLGLEDNLNVKIYANPKLDFNQMERLRIALICGVDCTEFATPEYTTMQMEAYRCAAIEGLNFKGRYTPKLSYSDINRIIDCWKFEKVDLTEYIEWIVEDETILNLLYECAAFNVDVNMFATNFLHKGYSETYLKYVVTTLIQGLLPLKNSTWIQNQVPNHIN